MHCLDKLLYLLLLSDCINKTPKMPPHPPFPFSLPHCPDRTLCPSSQPPTLQSSPMFLSISQFMISSQLSTQSDPFILCGAIVLQNQVASLFSHSAPSSVCIHISGLLRGRGDLRFTSHKSPQIFCSFYQQMVWLSFRATLLRPRTPRIFHACSSGGNPVLTFASQ